MHRFVTFWHACESVHVVCVCVCLCVVLLILLVFVASFVVYFIGPWGCLHICVKNGLLHKCKIFRGRLRRSGCRGFKVVLVCPRCCFVYF